MGKQSYLTTKELAELQGCSERYIRNKIACGDICAEQVVCTKNSHLQYVIPFAALPAEIKNQLTVKSAKKAVAKAKKAAEPLPEPKPLDTYTAAQREQIAFWLRICREWEQVRMTAASKTQARAAFVTEVQRREAAKLAEYGIGRLSDGILYRKYTAYKNNDYDALTERRGGYNRGSSTIDERLWNQFLYYWLDDRQPTVASCYSTVEGMTFDAETELYGLEIPSEMAFRRRIKADLDAALVILGREGEKAYMDRCMPYVDRLYDGLEANEYWIGDTHTLDFITTRTDGSKGSVRLYLCAWQDARSGVLVGWYISEYLNADTVLMALKHGIERFGIPRNVYIDNGREYLCADVGGKGHRSRKTDTDAPAPPPVFERMGITMVNALVRNAKAKPIERTFNTLKNQVSRLVSTFCGGNVTEKPESLKKHIKDGKLPIGSEMRVMVGEIIDSEYNMGRYGGKVRRDSAKSRLDVWNENIHTKRVATEGDLALLLMRSGKAQKISRNGVYLTIGGEKLWYYSKEITALLGQRVYIRYDAAALESVRVYMAETDEYIATVPMARDLMLMFGAEDKEAISTAMSLQREVKREDVKRLRAIRESVPESIRIDLLDWRIKKARELDFAEGINGNVPIEIVRSGEVPYTKPQSGGVIIDMKRIAKGL